MRPTRSSMFILILWCFVAPVCWLVRTTLGRTRALIRALREHASRQSRPDAADHDPGHSFSLIVAARQEAAVIERCLIRLAASNHPCFEIIAVIDASDMATAAAAQRAATAFPELIRVIIDEG